MIISVPILGIELHRYRQFVASYPDQTTYFQPILDVLDYRPSALENIPDVVMVEGKNDFYTLKYIKEIILGKGLNSASYLAGEPHLWIIRFSYISAGAAILLFC